jgi:microcystin-dependent protein
MSEPYIGEIRLFAGTYAPKDWAFCNGQLIPIQQNTALFAVIGTTYGGDGKTNFALPNLMGRAAMGAGQAPGLTPRMVGQTGGSETVTLTATQMPAHNHVPQCTGSASVDVGTEAIWAGAGRGGASMYATTPDTQMNAATLTTVGGNVPHNNMQPYQTVSYIICMNGLFPPRQ